MIEREELVRRASEMLPMLADRAAETEQLRRIPQETIDALLQSSLITVSQPVRFGGLGLDFDAVFDVSAELI